MPWDQTLYYGMGQQRGNGLSGFHTAGGRGCFTGVVYRGSKSDPSIVCQRGFVIRQSAGVVNGRQQTTVPGVNPDEGTTRGVISTAMNVTMAAHWAAYDEDRKNLEGWVYCIVLVDHPWAAEGERNMKKAAGWVMSRYQGEVMLRGADGGLKLSGAHIYGARPCAYKPVATKPHWTGPMQRNARFGYSDFMERGPTSKMLMHDRSFKAFNGGQMPDAPDLEAVSAQVPSGLH